MTSLLAQVISVFCRIDKNKQKSRYEKLLLKTNSVFQFIKVKIKLISIGPVSLLKPCRKQPRAYFLGESAIPPPAARSFINFKLCKHFVHATDFIRFEIGIYSLHGQFYNHNCSPLNYH